MCLIFISPDARYTCCRNELSFSSTLVKIKLKAKTLAKALFFMITLRMKHAEIRILCAIGANCKLILLIFSKIFDTNYAILISLNREI